MSRQWEAMLQSVAQDRGSIVASLNEGVDVVRVKAAEGGVGGTIVGFIDKGRLRVVLKHEPDPPAPGDWRLLYVKAKLPDKPCLARLVAEWSLFNPQDTDPLGGNADQVLSDFVRARGDYQAWTKTWQPPHVDAGTLVLHVSKKLIEDNTFPKKMLADLFTGEPDVFVVRRLTGQGRGETG